MAGYTLHGWRYFLTGLNKASQFFSTRVRFSICLPTFRRHPSSRARSSSSSGWRASETRSKLPEHSLPQRILFFRESILNRIKVEAQHSRSRGRLKTVEGVVETAGTRSLAATPVQQHQTGSFQGTTARPQRIVDQQPETSAATSLSCLLQKGCLRCVRYLTKNIMLHIS